MVTLRWGLLRDFEIFASFRIAFVSSSNVYLDQHLRGGLEVLDGHAGAVVPAGGDPLVVGHLGQRIIRSLSVIVTVKGHLQGSLHWFWSWCVLRLSIIFHPGNENNATCNDTTGRHLCL